MLRDSWTDLSGTWSFQYDDRNEGLKAHWSDSAGLEQMIVVPFPPESEASGIGDTGYHPIAWYQREVSVADLEQAGHGPQGERLLLHFGAVDYRCTAWIDGVLLGSHEGGHTPFTFDITDALAAERDIHSLTVRVEDDPLDVAQPRGKQDWLLQPHAVWYHRTTGIWQPVWLEAVPATAISHLALTPQVVDASLELSVELSGRVTDAELDVQVWLGDESLGALRLSLDADRATVRVPLHRLSNGQDYEQLLWSPDTPRLLDVRVRVGDDTVDSYVGLRTVAAERGAFWLNDRPIYLRSVLSQGYWPTSLMAAPSVQALRDEVQLILDLGFNAARVHQKIEDPRFLYWADRLGLLLWAEMPSAYEFSPTAVRRVSAEWSEVIRRDASHPSIVAWVPLNESWGVQHIAHDPAAQHHARALRHLTLSLDPTRPVISNDGWEQLDSDIWTIHDYEASGDVVRERYLDAAAVATLFDGVGPAGRRLRISDEPDRGQPIMLTEFGGVKFVADSPADDAWGYSTAASTEDLAERLGALLDAVRASSVLAGFCYTQLTDTGQETNGLVTSDRLPKLPVEQLRSIVSGEPVNPQHPAQTTSTVEP